MFGNVFQSSKSALAFAGAVVVTALMLVGSKESGGVLDKAVTTYKAERTSFASNAATVSAEMSTPVIEDYVPSGLEESATAAPMPATPGTRIIRLDPESMQPIGELPAPPGIVDGSYAAPADPIAVGVAEPAPREAVVTSRMIRIEPK